MKSVFVILSLMVASVYSLADTSPEGYFLADPEPAKTSRALNTNVHYPMPYMQYSQSKYMVQPMAYARRTYLPTALPTVYSNGLYRSSAPYFYPQLGLY